LGVKGGYVIVEDEPGGVEPSAESDATDYMLERRRRIRGGDVLIWI
jgi:hypothetical protein